MDQKVVFAVLIVGIILFMVLKPKTEVGCGCHGGGGSCGGCSKCKKMY
jgi:hypothetical protein